MDLTTATKIALELVIELDDFCKRSAIAGSVRREKPDVHDIEIVCQPITSFAGMDTPLFTGALYSYLANPTGKLARATKIKGAYKYQQWALEEGINLDLFIVTPPAQWGVILAIRTGPAQLSQALVTQRSKGGLLPSWAHVKNGAVWYTKTGELIEMATEAEFFQFCGLPFVEPRLREEMAWTHSQQ